jgi:glycosyltransferase involved in cell wall biosynthesis
LLPRHNASVSESFRRAVRAWAEHAEPHDVVHAHDMPMFPVAAELAERWGAALVYDAHEWWSGRRREQRPTPLADRRERALERRLAVRADVVLTVSQGIADRLRAWGASEVRVVRNTFPVGTDAPEPVNAVTSLLYAGRVDGGRDLVTVFAAVARGIEVPLTLLGPVDRTFVVAHPVPPGVTLLGPVAPDDVDRHLRAAGAALVTLDDGCENHRLALPNKLYQAVRAGVPVLASDLPEIARVVTEYGIGELYTPGDAASLQVAAARVRADPQRYAPGLVRARRDLTWEVDAAVLVSAYATMGNMRSREASG